MASFRSNLTLALAVVLAFASAAPAQQAGPRIGYVYPAGGQRSAACEVTVGGQFLDGVNRVFISGDGVQASVSEHIKPINQKQFNALRERLQELQKKPRTAENLKEIAEIRKKISTFVRRPANPGIAETAILRITLAADAEVGQRELRLATPTGLSNPLVFCVGQLPEFSEKAAKLAPQPKPGKGPRGKQAPVKSEEPDTTITLPATVNGQIMPGDVDRYRFQARNGQHLVVAASARELRPYLADGVPGWFQATLALYDAKGKELAYEDDFRFHPDPVLHCVVPEDGQYVIEVKDAIYRGREDFVYRIAVGDLPYVTSIFPLGGRAGQQTSVELKGWNLPQTTLTQDTKDQAPGIHAIAVRQGEVMSNREPFAVDTLPECLEKEPNDRPQTAQPVKLPMIVNGRIDQPGDSDVFRVEGRSGQELVAEVYARRLDSPVDSVLRLTDAAGRQLAFNDDCEDKGSALHTHHADSRLSVRLPADGAYYLYLGDGQHKGGSEYAYRLRISPPRPDFELRVVPSTINARPGTSVPITVYALRRDGFAGEIALELTDAPTGFALGGAVVPAGQD